MRRVPGISCARECNPSGIGAPSRPCLPNPTGTLANPDTGDNFSTNRFPLAVAQFLQAPGVNGAQVFAQTARIYLDPGDTVSMSFDFVAAGALLCRAQLNGHFVAN